MGVEKEQARISIDEERAADQARPLAGLQLAHGSERRTRTWLASSQTIIVLLLIVNLALFAQCLGLCTFIHPRSDTSLESRETVDALAVEQIPSATWGDAGTGNTLARRRMTTALTEPSVSCDLCPEGDDFCMELG